VEVNVGIICTCLPVLRQLLVRIFPVLGGTKTGKSSYGYGPYARSREAGGSRVGKSNNRSRSRTLDNFSKNTTSSLDSGAGADSKGHNTSAGVGVGVHRGQGFADVKSPGIVLQQTYGVRYDDDETSLVALQDLQSQSAQKPRSVLNSTLSRDFR
jgi:hypothetical protein